MQIDFPKRNEIDQKSQGEAKVQTSPKYALCFQRKR